MKKSNSSAGSPIKKLLRRQIFLKWLLSVQLIRMPALMTPFAFVLLSNHVTGSESLGGIMVTIYVLCLTFFAIPGGRLVDKIGIKNGVPLLLILTSIVFVGLSIVVTLKFPTMFLLFFTGLSGALAAGASGPMRVLLTSIIPKELLSSAISIDATVVELIVVLSPLVVSLTTLFLPTGAIITMALITFAAAILIWVISRNLNIQSSPSNIQKSQKGSFIWWNKGFVYWVLISIVFGNALGTAEIAVIPLSIKNGGEAGSAGILIAILAFSSAISGLIYSHFSSKIPFTYKIQSYILLAIIVTGIFCLSLSSTWFLLVISLILIGSCTAPLFSVRSVAVEDDIPNGRKSEGFSLINVSHTLGFALSGLLLATLPLTWMIIIGGISGLILLITTPYFLKDEKRKDSNAKISF